MKKILCSSLVATVWKCFNKDDVHVQLAHLSIQTYLTSEEIKTGKVKHFSFSIQSEHTLISQTCLFMALCALLLQLDNLDGCESITDLNSSLAIYMSIGFSMLCPRMFRVLVS